MSKRHLEAAILMIALVACGAGCERSTAWTDGRSHRANPRTDRNVASKLTLATFTEESSAEAASNHVESAIQFAPVSPPRAHANAGAEQPAELVKVDDVDLARLFDVPQYRPGEFSGVDLSHDIGQGAAGLIVPLPAVEVPDEPLPGSFSATGSLQAASLLPVVLTPSDYAVKMVINGELPQGKDHATSAQKWPAVTDAAAPKTVVVDGRGQLVGTGGPAPAIVETASLPTRWAKVSPRPAQVSPSPTSDAGQIAKSNESPSERALKVATDNSAQAPSPAVTAAPTPNEPTHVAANDATADAPSASLAAPPLAVAGDRYAQPAQPQIDPTESPAEFPLANAASTEPVVRRLPLPTIGGKSSEDSIADEDDRYADLYDDPVPSAGRYARIGRTENASKNGSAYDDAPQQSPTDSLAESGADFTATALVPSVPTGNSNGTDGLLLHLEQAQRHIHQGFGAANRGMLYTARREFLQALQTVTEAHDAHYGTRSHGEALAEGLNALDEAERIRRATGSAAKTNLAMMVRAHKTPVLKDEDVSQLVPLVVMDRYHEYASRKLGEAVAGDPAGSMSLYGLARIYEHLGNKSGGDRVARSRQSAALHKAALMAHPENHLAAHELGVVLHRLGRRDKAIAMLQRSAQLKPTATALRNLAKAYQQAGDQVNAAAVQQRAVRLAQGNATDQQSLVGPVRWMDPRSFSATSERTALTAAATPTPTPQSEPTEKGWRNPLQVIGLR